MAPFLRGLPTSVVMTERSYVSGSLPCTSGILRSTYSTHRSELQCQYTRTVTGHVRESFVIACPTPYRSQIRRLCHRSGVLFWNRQTARQHHTSRHRRPSQSSRGRASSHSLMIKALFSSQKILQNISYSPSHRIFRRMHEVLNIDKNKN